MPLTMLTEQILVQYCRLSLTNFISIISKPVPSPACFFGIRPEPNSCGLFLPKGNSRHGGTVDIRLLCLYRLMGTATSVLGLKCIRRAGVNRGPCPVGLASTINNWFPPKEKATATGVYIAATMFAPILVPPLAVWIAMTWGWRWVFSPLRSPARSLPSCGICWYARSRPRAHSSRKRSWRPLPPVRRRRTPDGKIS